MLGSYKFEVLTSVIPDSLHEQLVVVRNSHESVDIEDGSTSKSDKIDLNKKLMYQTTYTDGSFCDSTKKGRISKITFYCDQYAEEKDKSFKILDTAETDICEYSFKISTRFLCSKSSILPKVKAKTALATEDTIIPSLQLDAGVGTQRQNIDCNILTNF